MSGILNVMLGASFVFQPVTRTYNAAGSFTETIPPFAHTAVIEAWGGSGGGGSGAIGHGGGGGGSGGYVKTTLSVLGHGSQTMAIMVGAAGMHQASSDGTDGGNTSVSSGTFTLTTMAANGGVHGNAGTGTNNGLSGSGGTASGGNTNTPGNGGGSPQVSGAPGGAGIAGVNGTGATGGNGGASGGGAGTDGGPGLVKISYT